LASKNVVGRNFTKQKKIKEEGKVINYDKKQHDKRMVVIKTKQK